MRLTVIAIGFFLGVLTANLMLSAKIRLLQDKAFVKGWAGALRYQDERDPEVKP